MSDETIRIHAALIWSVADLLRGDYKQSEYGKVILPLTVLRRLDCVLEPTKAAVLAQAERYEGRLMNLDPILEKETGHKFFNTSKYDFRTLLNAPDDLAGALNNYIAGFSATAQDIIDKFDLPTQILRLDRSNLLYLVVAKFAEIDLHPDKISNLEMGYLYEELVRKFSELSNETAGEHFTPREVIRLMVDLVFQENDSLSQPGVVKTLLDPACGTGGMLWAAQDRLREINSRAKLEVFGQEINAETYAICRSDMMLRGQDTSNIAFGNSFTEDGHPGLQVDYLLANPPFGVEWKRVAEQVKDEADRLGFAGRFGAGLPRINDASFLFLQHMISKMKPASQGGSRLAVLFSGSPLFTGAAGSGESAIRRWIIENDWLEAVVALPDQLFYNTGISTYLWIVTNRKSPERQGKVQLIDARDLFVQMRTSLGTKRKQINSAQIEELGLLHGAFTNNDRVRILPNSAFRVDPGNETSPPLFAFSPWMFATNVEPGTDVPLSDIGAINPEIRTTVDGDVVLTVEGLKARTPITALSHEVQAGRRLQVCRGGDIVGLGSHWYILPDDFGESLTVCDVLRTYEKYRHVRHLLAFWLRSSESQLQQAGYRFRLRRDLYVPQPILANPQLGLATADYVEAQDRARRLVDSLFGEPFQDLGSIDAISVREQAARSEAIVRLLRPLTDVIHRAEWAFPVQIAQLARQFRLSISVETQVDAAIRLLEALIRQLGVLAGSSIRELRPQVWPKVLDYFRGGISTGNWLRIVKDAQDLGVLQELPELAELSFKKRGTGAVLV